MLKDFKALIMRGNMVDMAAPKSAFYALVLLIVLIAGTAGCNTPPSSQAQDYFNKGRSLSDEGKYDEAIIQYQKAIELDPNGTYSNDSVTYSSYGGLGYCYLMMKQYDLAISSYSKGINLSPENPALFNGRGYAYINNGQFDLAVKDFNQVIALAPEDPTGYNGRGVTYLSNKQYDLALKDFEKSVQLNPNQPQVQQNLDYARRMVGSSGGGGSGGGGSIMVKTLTGEWVSHGSNVMFEQANYFYYDIVLSVVEDASGNIKGTWIQTLLDTTVKMPGVTWPIGIPDKQSITGRRTGETVQLNYGRQVVRLKFTGDSLWGEQHYYDYGSPVGGTPTFYEELHPELGSSYLYWTYRVNLYRK